ncbi:hypothetical protein POTOM_015996 [Populus tomentosa]|uniref:Uncharacterized protein n=1 Tax=Populus tomentosa TaxID=118781 RepID=A0A8X7ZYT3_POPTO|nr:hypothetical protein POTOM_015996 [Populus tomentosa]
MSCFRPEKKRSVPNKVWKGLVSTLQKKLKSLETSRFRSNKTCQYRLQHHHHLYDCHFKHSYHDQKEDDYGIHAINMAGPLLIESTHARYLDMERKINRAVFVTSDTVRGYEGCNKEEGGVAMVETGDDEQEAGDKSDDGTSFASCETTELLNYRTCIDEKLTFVFILSRVLVISEGNGRRLSGSMGCVYHRGVRCCMSLDSADLTEAKVWFLRWTRVVRAREREPEKARLASSSKEIGVSLAWTALASSVYSEPSPSRIRSDRFSMSTGAPRMASSSALALMVCRNSETPRDPLVSCVVVPGMDEEQHGVDVFAEEFISKMKGIWRQENQKSEEDCIESWKEHRVDAIAEDFMNKTRGSWKLEKQKSVEEYIQRWARLHEYY